MVERIASLCSQRPNEESFRASAKESVTIKTTYFISSDSEAI